MNAILVIVIVSVFVGMASAAWLMVIIMVASKKVKNKAILKRWLRTRGLLCLAVVLLVSCSPSKMVGTGYLVSIDSRTKKDFVHKRFSTADSADAFIFKIARLDLNTPGLISTDPPFYDFKNGEYYIYVEKQALYQRPGGKKHWKLYDEKIAPSVQTIRTSLTPDISPKGRENKEEE